MPLLAKVVYNKCLKNSNFFKTEEDILETFTHKNIILLELIQFRILECAVRHSLESRYFRPRVVEISQR